MNITGVKAFLTWLKNFLYNFVSRWNFWQEAGIIPSNDQVFGEDWDEEPEEEMGD